MEKDLVSIVILTYNGEGTIENCLNSVFNQAYENIEIIVVDNASTDSTARLMQEKYLNRIKLIGNKKNIGFAGMNVAIDASKGKYILYLNQDVILEPSFIFEVVNLMEQDEKIGIIQGKLLRKDSDKKIIDSVGIKIFKSRRMVDRGQGEEDKGQYNKIEEVFGCNGAVSFFRKKCLENVKIDSRLRGNDTGGSEFYDPNFFLYKEDVDLSWRVRLYGWKIMYCPLSVAYVDRTTKPINERSGTSQMIVVRKKQKDYVQYYSFKNHRLAMIKNELPWLFLKHLPWILPREIGYWLYVLFFEPKTWPAIRDLFKQMPNALRKRKIIMKNKKVGVKEMGKWFN